MLTGPNTDVHPSGKARTGAIRIRCPQCDGRVMTSAKTWRYRHRRTKPRPNPDIPYVGAIEEEYCCRGTVTIPVEKLDTYQLVPYGTPAWKKSYNRRIQIENLNGIVKDRNGLKDGWCRAFGLAAHNLGLLVLLVAHNLRQAKRYLYRCRQQSTESNGQQPLPPTPAATPPSASSRNGLTTRGPPT